jgi:hypothetical protein
MTPHTLPEGARLALLKWPGGQPGTAAVVQVLPSRDSDPWRFSEVVQPLLDAALIEEVPGDWPHLFLATFRLTQAGRKAWDVLQSGVE